MAIKFVYEYYNSIQHKYDRSDVKLIFRNSELIAWQVRLKVRSCDLVVMCVVKLSLPVGGKLRDLKSKST